MKNVLLAWIGNTDLLAAESEEGSGPIDLAVRQRNYDTVVLLCNYKKSRWKIYENWLKDKFPRTNVLINSVTMTSPTNYSEIYEKAISVLESITGEKQKVKLTFHLSPGTPAMAAVWLMIAGTRFPARLIESSQEEGVKDVDFPFDISAEYIPKLKDYVEERIIDFSESLPPNTPEFKAIIYKSRIMKNAVELTKKAALFDFPILLLGESGTGKELFARAAWSMSERSKGPFIAVNCGAIPESLAESELFGYVKGAFTGALNDRPGKIEAADGGILFLDEIGELPKEIQVKLLRVIQEKELYRIGSASPVKVDFRIISATNRDLIRDTAQGAFRQDLFHRIAIAVIKLPALRDRGSDLSLLTDFFLEEINNEFKNQKGWVKKKMADSGRRALRKYPWPGNVRELVNTLMRVTLWSNGSLITAKDVEMSLLSDKNDTKSVLGRSMDDGFSLEELLGEVAVSYMERAMEEAKGNKSKAADILGFKNYQTLSNWLDRYGLKYK